MSISFEQWEAELDNFTSLVVRFTEYLHHEVGLPYSEMSKILGVSQDLLEKAEYDSWTAFNIVDVSKKKIPDYWKAYHDFYGFSREIDHRLKLCY